MIKEAIILAGGMGTRLKGVVEDLPKPMAPINNKPFLEYQLNYLSSWGINHVVLSVGYKHEIIQHHFKNNYRDIKIDYSIETKPLGTGGGILKAFDLIEGRAAYVFNGDTLFDVDLKRLHNYMRIKETNFSIALRYAEDLSRFGSVKFDKNNLITSFTEKNPGSEDGYVNGGVYCINKNYLERKASDD